MVIFEPLCELSHGGISRARFLCGKSLGSKKDFRRNRRSFAAAGVTSLSIRGLVPKLGTIT